jgi:AcrR family transcriptional regulator
MPQKAAPGLRDRILDTAAALFYENGVRAVGMQQIINTAGCGKMLLYREFAGKSDLVVGYLGKAQVIWDDRVRRVAAGAGGPEAQLIALITAVVEQVGESGYRGCPFRNHLTEFSDHSDEAGQIAVTFLRDMRARVSELVHQLALAHPGAVADQIWLIIEGLYGVSARLDGDEAVNSAIPLVRHLVQQTS